ncbi:hypothetical protein BU26DRAFT_107310 [Trematosphaeria pertusa]|uniref:Uncharacterized protein n=1 Tax=Trematosphaeria pertusa TaxID=390896 RepID=A0A6A6I154_9PLEO|nr:uncharacterized protein BU26DRAFT_107310 [Trematosphaeria pertusa]KAF2243702.1 hypothetical protein BU26DRAFT_107310 [Trematosphaeria pertusa]
MWKPLLGAHVAGIANGANGSDPLASYLRMSVFQLVEDKSSPTAESLSLACTAYFVPPRLGVQGIATRFKPPLLLEMLFINMIGVGVIFLKWCRPTTPPVSTLTLMILLLNALGWTAKP